MPSVLVSLNSESTFKVQATMAHVSMVHITIAPQDTVLKSYKVLYRVRSNVILNIV